MAEWTDLSRAIVLPRHCDHYGHMNVRYYASFFDDAGWHILNICGIQQQDLRARNIGTVVANISIDFHHEIKVSNPFLIRGGLQRLGSKSFTHVLQMLNADTGTLCATQTSVEVCFDTDARKAILLPDDLKAKLSTILVDETAA